MARLDVPSRALVVGFAVTAQAMTRELLARGHCVTVADDRPTEAALRAAEAAGLELVASPTAGAWESLVEACDVVLPSPGVPSHHPVFAVATQSGVPVWSEFELAARWSDLPIAAITGTNGKTTVTVLVTEMLERSGVKTVAAGNTDVPLVDVLDLGLDVAVVEASSFRLQLTETFAPRVGTWLNLAEDHLDWHASLAEYASAKARIWVNQTHEDLAIANADDAAVIDRTRVGAGRLERFSIAGSEAEWRWDRHAGRLVGPTGPFVSVDQLQRRLPHDLANALAATATAVGAGASIEACADVLVAFRGLAHRVALVAEAEGVKWYDDSKATTPASVLAAVGGFGSVVLIAGGRNKGLDLTILGSTVPPVRAVIAIGDAAAEVEAAFDGRGVGVRAASSMGEAVAHADALSRPGDAVLLSPGCASFDWYRNYAERGDDFARLVIAQTGAAPAPALPSGGSH